MITTRARGLDDRALPLVPKFLGGLGFRLRVFLTLTVTLAVASRVTGRVRRRRTERTTRVGLTALLGLTLAGAACASAQTSGQTGDP